MALQPSGSLCHTPLESTSRPLHVEGPRRGSLGTVWASQLGPRHIHPSAAGTRATPPGRGIQHRLPGHQPVLEVFPPLAWVSSGDPAVSDCTPQEQPGTRCFPSRHVCRCPVPWGRPLQPCLAFHALYQLGSVGWALRPLVRYQQGTRYSSGTGWKTPVWPSMAPKGTAALSVGHCRPQGTLRTVPLRAATGDQQSGQSSGGLGSGRGSQVL